MSEDWPDYYEDPVGHCLAAFEHGNDSERFNAADILRGLAQDAEPAIPKIVEVMRSDRDDQVRAQCAFAMVDIGYAVKDRAAFSVPALIETLESDPFAEARSLAANALESIGPSARDAIPALTAALHDEHEWVREAAHKALERLRDESAKEQ